MYAMDKSSLLSAMALVSVTAEPSHNSGVTPCKQVMVPVQAAPCAAHARQGEIPAGLPVNTNRPV
jgi:hypothetical protein